MVQFLVRMALLLAIFHQPPRHLRIPLAERRRRQDLGDEIPQRHHQHNETDGRDEQPPNVTDDPTNARPHRVEIPVTAGR